MDKNKIINYLNFFDYDKLFKYLKSINLNENDIEELKEMFYEYDVDIINLYSNLLNSNLNEYIKKKLFDPELFYSKVDLNDIHAMLFTLANKIDVEKYYKEMTELFNYLSADSLRGLWESEAIKFIEKLNKHLDYLVKKTLEYESSSLLLFLLKHGFIFKLSDKNLIKKVINFLINEGFCEDLKKLYKEGKILKSHFTKFGIEIECLNDDIFDVFEI